MTRVRVVDGPWPERIGCEGVIVPDPGDGVYPFSRLPKSEVVILLDDDPVVNVHNGLLPCGFAQEGFVYR